METRRLPSEHSYLAPDGSQIRLLPDMKHGGLAHCTLPPHHTASAHSHKTVEEIWYFIQGLGQVWHKDPDGKEVVDVSPGMCVTIPTGTHFQFRNTGEEPLCFLIATMPVWPGPNEAQPVKDHWDVKPGM
jgi:mannose-6-phosphate isomerase-like protein (cupin superfamily)